MCRWKTCVRLAVVVLCAAGGAASGDEPSQVAGQPQDLAAGAPRSVAELWAEFDPRAEPLDVKTVREWDSAGITARTVTFQTGRFLGHPARMAAFYAFPKGASKRLPALLHLHGGGQRAFLHEVEFYAKRGYACLSLNWGGREMERAEPGDPNTDWGAVDPTQKNVPGYNTLRPAKNTLDAFDSPRNNNWYLLTLAARRGLTFLEQQPEVDPDRLGVYGHSMGGNLTVYVAGCDERVKAAAPSVGGSGFRFDKWPLLPEHKPQMPNGDPELFRATLGFESYAPRIRAPLLWLGSTNDFHGIMDDTYRTGDLVPHEQVRYVFAPHLNHRFTPEFAVARPLWFDQWLMAGPPAPRTAETRLILDEGDGVPTLNVRPDTSREIVDVHIYYSVDPDPRARFWRSADAIKTDFVKSDAVDSMAEWSARLPILSTAQPLHAFANVVYSIPRTESEPYARPTERWAFSSRLHTATPGELARANIRATDKVDPVIDDFTRGWRDWYALSADNPHHWEYSTRKLSDPKWRGAPGRKLAVTARVSASNDLIVVLTENFFRGYRGAQREYTATVKLTGGPDATAAMLSPSDFRTPEGVPLETWSNVDVLSLRPYFERGTYLVGGKSWTGPQPEFRRLWWADQ